MRICSRVGVVFAVLVAALAAVLTPSPVAALDKATIQWDVSDPHIMWDDATKRYYMYTTEFFGAVVTPVWWSIDGVSWQYHGDAKPQYPQWAAKKETWAPSVHKFGDTYVMHFVNLHTASSPHRRCIGTATSHSPLGPFAVSNSPMLCDKGVGGQIDPFVFRAPNGTPYLLWKDDVDVVGGAARISVRQLNSAGTGFAAGSKAHVLLRGSPGWEGNYVENPAMFESGGRFFLLYSANAWTDMRYATGYAVCDSPVGPCSKPLAGSPLLGNDPVRWGPGGASVVSGTPAGTLIAYHGFRNNDGPTNGYVNDGVRAGFVQRLLVHGDRLSVADVGSPTGNQTRPGGSNPVGECRTRPGNEWFSFRSSARHAQVYRLYCAYFLRFPDLGGFQYWTDLSYQGLPVMNISDEFAVAQEFMNRYGTLTNEQFVRALYQNIMLRQPDSEGLRYWVAEIGAGRASRGYVVLLFADSAEFVHRTGTN